MSREQKILTMHAQGGSGTFVVHDFAGQDEYAVLQTLFVVPHALYAVVFNVAEFLDADDDTLLQVLRPIQKWLSTARMRAPRARVLLIGTQLDNVPSERRVALVKEVSAVISSVIAPSWEAARVSVPAEFPAAAGHTALALSLTSSRGANHAVPSTTTAPRSKTPKTSTYKEWECSVCRNAFDRLERSPRSLLCSHVFCSTCLTTNSPRTCPVCKAEYSSVDALSVAYGLITLAESKATVSASPPPRCTKCYKGKNIAVAHCITCQTELCETHADKHAEEHHDIEVLEGTTKAPSKLVLCPLLGHREPLKLYCRDCGVPLCHMCASMHHVGHKLIELHIVEASVVPELESTVSCVAQLADRSVAAAATVAEVSQDVAENQARVAATIEAAMQQLHDAVTARGKQLLQELGQFARRKSKVLRKQHEHLQLVAGRMRSSCDLVTSALDEGEVRRALSLKSELDQYARSQREEADGSGADRVPAQSEWEPRTDAVLDFRVGSEYREILQMIATLGDVQPVVAGGKGKGKGGKGKEGKGKKK